MLRTYQPKKLQRKKEHGFRKSRQRPQGSCPPQSQGQSPAQRLRRTVNSSGKEMSGAERSALSVFVPQFGRQGGMT